MNSHILPPVHPTLARLAVESAKASPVLRAYQVVGRAEDVLTSPETYGVETMRWARARLAKVREEIVSLRTDIHRRKIMAEQEEDWAACVGSRVVRCDERSYASECGVFLYSPFLRTVLVSVFTLSICLLRTNLCAIRREVELLTIEGSADPEHAIDPFTLSLAHTYQDNIALLLSDIREFARFQALLYTPASNDVSTETPSRGAKRTPSRLPSYILTEDVSHA